MGYGMNAHEEEVDKKYDIAVHNMAQAHLAQKFTMSNMSNSSTQMDAMHQQMNDMQKMFQKK